jgi:bifunctional non-homologous end joining protein LigD
MTKASQRTVVEIEGRELTLSNLDKVLYPAVGFTKGEVLDYYVRIAPVLLPHISDRPLTMRRFPDGVEGESFYEKHLPRGTPAWVRHARLPASPNTKNPAGVEFAIIGDVSSLAWAANLASLELHVPMWRVGPGERPDPPDLMVFDLDPGDPATVVECARVALVLAEELEATKGWRAYPKTSGSKGLQLYVPLAKDERPTSWEEGATRDEAKRLAARLAKERPDEIVSVMNKDVRDGKVLIDWSQNHVAKTTVAPYSLRARAEPTVSTPITWEEVERCAKGGHRAAEQVRFLPADVLARVADIGDLFAPLASDDR